MKYDMEAPCPQCPFRNDIDGYLTKGRVREIVQSVLRQESFPCHKTTVESESCDGDCDMRATSDSQQCAGAEIFAMKHGVCSQMSRIAGRLGMHVAELDMSSPVCDSLREMLKVHGGAR